MKNLVIVCGAAALIGCGSSSATPDSAVVHDTSHDTASPQNQVNGQVEGHTFAAKDAIWKQFDSTNGFSFSGPAGFVEMTDFANACSLAAQGQAPTGSLILDLGVATTDASGMAHVPTTTGSFTVHADTLPASANVAQIYYGSGCTKDLAYGGVSGTVTISAIHADGSYDGTFDVMISCSSFSSCAGPDVHLTGSFSSAACSSLDVNRIPTCS